MQMLDADDIITVLWKGSMECIIFCKRYVTQLVTFRRVAQYCYIHCHLADAFLQSDWQTSDERLLTIEVHYMQ